MAIRIAINGFGRIGRCVLRAALNDDRFEFVHINDLTSVETLAHLLEYDTVHGRYEHPVTVEDGHLVVAGKRIEVSAVKDPTQLPWGEKQVDVVLECTGVFRTREGASKHLEAGAKKVVISAPGQGVDATIVVGVNDHLLDGSQQIVSNASCTTNCLAPVAKVLNDTFGIVGGQMTTVHSYTMDQRLLDAPHKDLRRGRAAAQNMVPTSTGAAVAVGLVLPELQGKLHGYAIRVPTPNVSLVDLTVSTQKAASVDAVNAAIRQAAAGAMHGVLATSTAPVVSSDLVGAPASSTVDLPLTDVVGDHLVKVVTWYDNEWGFSNRMLDLTRKLMEAGA